MANRSELLTRLQHIVATEQNLATDAPALARRIRAEAGVISDVELLELMRTLRHDTTGLGKLEAVISQPGVTDVVVNGPHEVFVDKGAGLEPAHVHFDDEAEIRRLATRLAIASGARLDDSQPYADGHLARPDGTAVRLHAVLAPPAVGSTCISLRVLRQSHTSLQDLIARGALDEDIAQALSAMVHNKVSFLICGGTGSGKTTLLGALLAQVAQEERVLIIEDTTELSPPHPHVVSLASRRANAEGSGAITLADLLKQALRMRPDRIVVGEIRGAEVVDLLAALNTGHEGGAGTVHANSLHEVPARLEALAALGGMDRQALHSQLAAAVRVVLAVRRGAGGKRELHQIGILSPGESAQVRAVLAWSADEGRGPAWEQFMQLAASRDAEPAAPALSARRDAEPAAPAATVPADLIERASAIRELITPHNMNLKPTVNGGESS